MNKFIFPAILILLNSCGSLGEAGKILRNEKIKTTDEFLEKNLLFYLQIITISLHQIVYPKKK